jgi:hypothetical protein
MRWRSPGRTALLASSLLALGLAGCGSSNNISTTNVPPTTPISSPLSTSLPTTAFVHAWTWSASAEGGYSESGELKTAALERYQGGLVNGQDSLGTGCTGNDTDAVAPFQLTLTNSTPGFSANTTILVSGLGSGSLGGGGTSELDAEVSLSSGPTCFGSSNGATQFDVNSASLAPNSSSIVDGFFILTNYYSPAQPTGDAALLQNALLTIPAAQYFSASLNYVVTSVTGPTVVKKTGEFANLDSWQLNLEG